MIPPPTLDPSACRRLRTELSRDEKKLNGFLSRSGFHPVEGVVMDLDVKESW